jgi:hypothetical protein
VPITGLIGSAPIFSLSNLAINGGPLATADGGPLFRGGVLMPDGRVLLTPALSPTFVVVDLDIGSAFVVGEQISGAVGRPFYGAAVLGCDGAVYALPDSFGEITRIVPRPRPSMVADFSHYPVAARGITGAVLSDICDDAVHIAAAAPGLRYEFTVYPDGGVVTVTKALLADFALDAGPQGLVRFNDQGYWLMPVPSNTTTDALFYELQLGGIPLEHLCLGTPDAGCVAFGGAAAASRDGLIVFNQTTGNIEGIDGHGLPILGAQAFTGPMKWPLARGDGFIYGATDRLMIQDEGLQRLPTYPLDWGDGGVGPVLNGLVNTLGGEIIGVPGADPVVRVFRPDGGVPRSKALLLSPFYNKL